jgi:UDP-2,3-diacylglucosamine pyrophosphatase LpxH
VSDTHLHPERWFNVDDAVSALEALLDVIEAAGDRLVLLGDVTESLLSLDGPDFFRRLLSSAKTSALMRRLWFLPNLLIVPGNHDVKVVRPLCRYFGVSRVWPGPVVVSGRILALHGHEHAWMYQGVSGDLSRTLIPVLNPVARFLRRTTKLDIQRVVPEGDIEEWISELCVSSGVPYALFGHTHQAYLGRRVGNTGCFLRTGTRTAVRVCGRLIELLEVA